MPGLGGFDSFDASEGTKVTAGAGKHVVVANSLPKLAAIHLGTARRKASQGEERKEKDKERLHVEGGRKIISILSAKVRSIWPDFVGDRGKTLKIFQ